LIVRRSLIRPDAVFERKWVRHNNEEKLMTNADLILLSKKIAVGQLLVAIPLLILGGGLWLAEKALTR
jgi:hypothetical protein